MKKISKPESENNIPPHRLDLADMIVQKARNIPQNHQLFFVFSPNPKQLIPTFLILISAFFIGFKSSAISQDKSSNQVSVLEEIYNSNSQIL